MYTSFRPNKLLKIVAPLKQNSSLFCLVCRSFVAVSEVYLKNYFDRSLSGALADQVR